MEIQVSACVFVLFFTTISFSTFGVTEAPNPYTAYGITVDQSGKGDFVKIQDAINAIPFSNSEYVFIRIAPGTYREKVIVNKPLVTLSGLVANTTIITGNAFGNIYESPTVTIMANDFVGRYLTIENTHGEGERAVALKVSGDRAVFYHCWIRSYQDTLFDHIGKHYYNTSFIQGGTDFIFGKAASLFENSHIQSLSEQTGAVTAQKRQSSSEADRLHILALQVIGAGKCFLGRPWGPYSRVVFAMTEMSNAILPQGWDDWGKPYTHSTVFYGEYQNYGPGATSTRRVNWSKKLTSEQVKPYLDMSMIGGRSWIRPAPTILKRPPFINHKY